MGDENHDFDVAVSDLATKVTTTFRQGADGVQIFVPYSQIADFMKKTGFLFLMKEILNTTGNPLVILVT